MKKIFQPPCPPPCGGCSSLTPQLHPHSLQHNFVQAKGYSKTPLQLSFWTQSSFHSREELWWHVKGRYQCHEAEATLQLLLLFLLTSVFVEVFGTSHSRGLKCPCSKSMGVKWRGLWRSLAWLGAHRGVLSWKQQLWWPFMNLCVKIMAEAPVLRQTLYGYSGSCFSKLSVKSAPLTLPISL